MKTKDLDTASVASDSPNTRHGQAQRSPLPWDYDYDRQYDRFAIRSKATGSFGHFQGWSADGVTTEAEDKANAAFIVRAVNNVERLAEALRDCITEQGAMAERSHDFALRRLTFITGIAQIALAEYERSKQ